MKIHMHYGSDPAFGPTTHNELGVGGTENFIINAARYLARAGHDVVVYNKAYRAASGIDGDEWRPLEWFVPTEQRDVLWSFRFKEVFGPQMPRTKLKALYLADTESHGLGEMVRSGLIDLAMFVGQWQADKISKEEGLTDPNVMVTSNGVEMQAFDADRLQWARVAGKCIHMSTPERGLEPLLDVWPGIQEGVPEANLHLYSSFKGWLMSDEDNVAVSSQLYERIEKMKDAGMTIFNHVHANAPELRQALFSSLVFLYPTRWFDETNCMCALEASAAGVPSVVTGRAALIERVWHDANGYLVFDDSAADHDAVFIKHATALLTDPYLWKRMSKAAVEIAQPYNYKWLADAWVKRWTDEIAARR